MTLAVASFYRFVPLADLPALHFEMKEWGEAAGLRGTILIAAEGVNGTVAGPPPVIEEAIGRLVEWCGIERERVTLSESDRWPFSRLKIRIRPEIITLRAAEADPSQRVGTYVEPSAWNALVDDPQTLLLDTRNVYETRVGGFAGAVDPQMQSFSDFKAFVASKLNPAVHRRVAMFCTGGIRCEKASAYMLSQGFDDVLHLKGGILNYLATVPKADSRWQGDCYVFDGRVAVGHGLVETQWTACHGCGHPLSPSDRDDQTFEQGVSCPYCHDQLTIKKGKALRERERQMSTPSIAV